MVGIGVGDVPGGEPEGEVLWGGAFPFSPVSPPSRRGFGSRLLTQGLAAELSVGARLDFEPTGLVCRIVAPVLGRVMQD